jgi:predicted CXXCH cytochrome family protein
MLRVISVMLVFVSATNAVDSKVCAQCHAEIYRRYAATPMARTSGAVDSANTPLPGPPEFMDPLTGTDFRFARTAGTTVLHFRQADVEGERKLDYFIGAGQIGRSYASLLQGFLFQAPISYYSSTAKWDLSPGFENADHLNFTRTVEPACLICHATGLKPVSGTVNGYESPPFLEDGVSCERCHGAGETHVARMKSADHRQGLAIVNPAKLANTERDSVCAQCHLVSVVRIAKVNGAGAYEPGKRLFDSTAAFVWNSGERPMPANSHFEQLVRSKCWRKSEGKLWCGTCHDPHSGLAKAEQAAAYRERCLTCHTATAPACSAPAQKRQAAGDKCVECHMPSRRIATVQHAAQVDHTISRVPGDAPDSYLPADAVLLPFPGSSSDDRELGLAYANEALPKNNRVWGMRALALLQKAAAANPGDTSVEVQLAQLYDRMGQNQQACDLFAQAAAKDQSTPGALVNLGTCQAKRGELDNAMKSWSEALKRNPALEAARVNLAVAQFQSGKVEEARANLQTALRFDPFSKRARELLDSLPAR